MHGFGMRNRERVKSDAFMGGIMAARFVDRAGDQGVNIPAGFFPGVSFRNWQVSTTMLKTRLIMNSTLWVVFCHP
jgi:hypothetical protein